MKTITTFKSHLHLGRMGIIKQMLTWMWVMWMVKYLIRGRIIWEIMGERGGLNKSEAIGKSTWKPTNLKIIIQMTFKQM